MAGFYPPRRTRLIPKTFVYFILAPNSLAVKVGKCSWQPASRLAAIQTGSPEPLILIGAVRGDGHYERRIHKALKATRIRGEWFQLDDTLRRFFRTIGIWHEILDTLPDFDEHLWNCDVETGSGRFEWSKT